MPTICMSYAPEVYIPNLFVVDATTTPIEPSPTEEDSNIERITSTMYLVLQRVWVQVENILAPDDPLEEEAFMFLNMQRLREEQVAAWQDDDIFFDAVEWFPEQVHVQQRPCAQAEPRSATPHQSAQPVPQHPGSPRRVSASASVRGALRKVRLSADKVSRRLAILANGPPGKKKEKLD